MFRDERWRRVGRRSAAVACAVGVGGAWLLLTRPLDVGGVHSRELPAAHGPAQSVPARVNAAQTGTRPNTQRAPSREPSSRDQRDSHASDLQHPLTAEHLALYRDSDLLDAGWRALQAHDFDRARTVLAQQRAESARGYDDLNDGLTILADCMQYPSAAARERAQRFYDEQTYSMARRRIRRYCLEPTP